MAAAILALTTASFTVAAHAAPPTVTPSPGYDARLQEQRRATSTTFTAGPSSVPANPPAPLQRHHVKRTHGH
ncbi:hypothetical protein [Bradyrhizobium sp. ARR65]|uniref:hypothetical protein n=1 Tax=Bradyrhizobium sp. ARR65 TaxID=1040989 RepID=UPI000684217D|nr:hypothetical protein [Bradyrhizobium sp. ARR65]